MIAKEERNQDPLVLLRQINSRVAEILTIQSNSKEENRHFSNMQFGKNLLDA